MTRPRKVRRAPIEPPVLPLLETPDTHPLIDKFGRRHTIHVLTAWSPRALQALDVHPLPSTTAQCGCGGRLSPLKGCAPLHESCGTQPVSRGGRPAVVAD
jgi:hypothetical protein